MTTELAFIDREERKFFFFEKKKQKTFVWLGARWGGGAPYCVRAFWFFFSKKNIPACFGAYAW
jgi:hypothetical protein